MRRPLPGKGVVEDEHVDARCADLELALDVLLVGTAAGRGNEHLGGQAGEKGVTESDGAPGMLWEDLYLGGGDGGPGRPSALPGVKAGLGWGWGVWVS